MSSERRLATLRRRGRFWIAEPVFAPRPAAAELRAAGQGGDVQLGSALPLRPGERAREGDLVLLSLPARAHGRSGRGARGARIEQVIGSPEVAANAIEALLLDRGHARRFDSELEAQAQRLRDGAGGAARDGRRRDLRSLPTLTIDPASARDFDDAISAQRLSAEEGAGLIRVWVHIADVCAFLPAGSGLDGEARRRSTSVYVPGTVEPMLPPALSNEACSLLPGQERLAVTVELDLEGARVLRSAAYRSLIRSDVRLDYDRVDRIFAGSERASDPWGPALEAARAAARALGEQRRSRARALIVEALEPEFSLDEGGHVRELSLRAQTESHELIEALMIQANETVAQLLAARRVPCLYRVHATPEPARVRRLIDQFASLGVPTPPVPEGLTSAQASVLMGDISARLERHLQRISARSVDRKAPRGRLALTSLLLRALPQAQYSPVNIGHAGLGSPCYCHFTSPIRRYPDVVCHRALLAAIEGSEPPPLARELPELGVWASERERDAMRTERDGDDIARCFALEALLFQEGFERGFTGEVRGLIAAGLFVAFGPREGEAVFEGMLPVRQLRTPDGERDWWELNEEATILRGASSHASIRLGDERRVRVGRVEKLRGRVDLEALDGDGRYG